MESLTSDLQAFQRALADVGREPGAALLVPLNLEQMNRRAFGTPEADEHWRIPHVDGEALALQEAG